ncbi:MAG TPA: DUF2177 family protein [Propionibacteriaceae bacterium]|nr:DUF2177 family protein [Propionibacteriaceae bacterium]
MTRRWWIALAVAAVTFGALDAVWLGVVARPLYAAGIGHLMAPQPDVLAAGAFYVLFLVALLYFVVRPNTSRTLRSRLTDAAFFGLVTYGTWDLTSRAVLRDFSWTVVIVDILWGITAATVTTLVVDRVLARVGPQQQE